jgi:hypothetical protein
MGFENSPSLNNVQKYNANPPRKITPTAQKRIRIIILFLSLFVFSLASINVLKSDATSALRGKGSMAGRVVDSYGKPFVGKIFVEGTQLEAITNPDGSFEMKDVPAGRRLVVISDGTIGNEFAVDIVAGQTIDLGKLFFQATATP